MHFTAYINWSVDRARPLFSIPMPWNSPSLHFRVSLSSLPNMQILLSNTLSGRFFKIFTTGAIGRWEEGGSKGDPTSAVIDSLLYFYITAVIPIPCHWQSLFWPAVSPLSGVPGMRWHLSALCLVWACSALSFINEIGSSHFLDFHNSTPSLSSPLMNSIWNRQRGICSLLGG